MAGEDPDRDILKRVAAGDVERFSVLVERHQNRLVGLCERFLGDREEARDVAQEVFLEAYRHAESFRPRGKVSTWLHRIAVNRCLNRLRRRKIVRFFSFGEIGTTTFDHEQPGTFDPEDPSPDPETTLATRRRWLQTRAVIDSLPSSQRSVLILAKFEGMTYREIAATLDITEGAVESRLFRAMRRLSKAQETES